MSKKVELDMECPRCKSAFKAMLHRTICVEDPGNLDLIMTDSINVVHCPTCGLSERQPFPFLATNARKNVAAWYEPIPDQNIDADVALYRQHFGDNYFLATALRIKKWAEFKRCLIELNKKPDGDPTVEEFARLRQGMRSAFAEANESRQNSKTLSPIARLRTWADKLRKAYPAIRLVSLSSKNRMGMGIKCSTASVNPITKLDQAISTWDQEQARIALAIFASTIFKDRAPLETLFGKGAKVETAVGRLTVGQLRVLYSIMTEIVPDDGDGDTTDR